MRGFRRVVARNYLLARKLWRRLYAAKAKAAPLEIVAPLPQDLENLVVVITGSSRGMGYTLAETFLMAGARVLINGRDSASVAKAESKLAAQFIGRVHGVAADVSTESGSSALVAAAVQYFGRVDVLINNAGVSGPIDKSVWDLSLSEWQQVIQTNVTGPYLCSRAVIQQARAQRQSVRIVNVSAGIVAGGAPNLGAYGVSKMGLEGLTMALAADADALVSVVSIRPRPVRTRMFEMHSAAAAAEDPQLVTAAFLYAATAPRAEIMGRSLSEPAFAVDPVGEMMLHGPAAKSQAIRLTPDTYRRDLPEMPVNFVGSYMHLLENPLGYFPAVAESLRAQIDSRKFFAYPDPSYIDLKRIIARQVGMVADAICVGAGSAELIDRALRLFAKPGDEVLVNDPTWPMFSQLCTRYDLTPRAIKHRGTLEQKTLAHELEGLLNAVTEKTRIIYLASPCSASGVVINARDLGIFLEHLPAHVLVLLDEAFLDYVDSDKRCELSKYLGRSQARVLGLRTFSKFFGLAGCRVGYAYGHTDVVSLLERAAMPFNVAAFSAQAAIAALADTQSRERTFNNNQQERMRISQIMAGLNIAYMPSQANFILYHCPTDPDAMRKAMLEKGLVLPGPLHFMKNYQIFPVGLPEHNDVILHYLSQH